LLSLNPRFCEATVAWQHSIVGRTLISAGKLSLSCASCMGDHFMVTLSAIGQPTWPTQPSIPPGSVNE